jgi:branched-chain amino acid transport system ATP-binding protein
VAEPLLVVDKLEKRFGGVRALHEVSFTVDPGQVVGLIGPNGSGKSTSVNVIAGVFPPNSGEIRLGGKPLSGMAISSRVCLGLARTFQTTSLFPDFKVLDQVLAACHTRFQKSPVSAVLRRIGSRRESREQEARAGKVLEFVGLGCRANEAASSLSSSEQRLLMIASALASEPRLLMLDEPAAGMVAQERKELARLIKRICERGIGVLVIEHHMGFIMEICEKIIVLDFGEKIAEGTPSEIGRNQAVIDAYLGKAH